MQEQSFEKVAEEAAACLKPDRELYLEVTAELTGRLEDKAAQFAREGHTAEESAALAQQAFGSPQEMAAACAGAPYAAWPSARSSCRWRWCWRCISGMGGWRSLA